MATLNSTDYEQIRQKIKSDPVSNAAFRTWGLSKSTWYALFQAAETWFVTGFTSTPTTSFKAAVEAVTGTATNAQAKQVAFVWMGWRFEKNI